MVAYELAKLMVDRPESRLMAIKLLEPLRDSPQFLGYDVKESPALILAKAWLAEGQRAKAVESLMTKKSLILNPGMASNTSQSERASQMLNLGLPIDSYRQLVVPTAGGRRPNNSESLAVEKAAIALKQKAIETLEKMPAATAVAEILLDRTMTTRRLPAMELMLRVPALEDILGRAGSIDSIMQSTLVRHARNGQLPTIEEGLQKLATANPTDLTVLSTQAIVRLELGNTSVSESLKELEQLLSKFDPQIDELVASTYLSDTKLLTTEVMQAILATWLVARKCVAMDKHLEEAERIGNRAFKVARVLDAVVIRSRPTPAKNNPVWDSGPEAELANLILFEWGRAEMQAGRLDQGFLKWQELKNRVALMNDAEKETAFTASKSPVERVWQRDSFTWMLLLAHSALDAQQLDFSKAVARELSERRLPATIPYVSGLRKVTELEAKPSAQKLNQLLVRWPTDKETASERFAALLRVVLPGDSDVYLFIQNTNLIEEKPISLAANLVESAKQSDRLKELKDILELREPKEGSNMSWLILRSQVAIAARDTVEASEFLGRLRVHVQGEKQLTNIANACHAAIPAFQIEELREIAIPMLNDYLAAMKKTGNYPEVDFSLFPLVRQVNDYLKNK